MPAHTPIDMLIETPCAIHARAAVRDAEPATERCDTVSQPARARPVTDRVASLTVWFIIACLALVVGRVAQLQIRPTDGLRPFIDDRTTSHVEPGVRGDLRDRRGRLLASTRFGERAFIDPTRFPVPPDEHLALLADALGEPMDQIASRVVPRIMQNMRRAELLADAEPSNDPAQGPSRYVSIGGVLEEHQVQAVKSLKIPGVYFETRAVREVPGEELLAGLLGKVGIDHDGLLGIERSVDRAVQGTAGRMHYVRDAGRRPLWVEEDSFTSPERGMDVRLSIDLELQRIAHEELMRGIEDADAAGGRLIAADPHTGEILAMVDIVRDLPGLREIDWDNPPGMPGAEGRYRTIRVDPKRWQEPSLARNRIVEDVYEPGSTFKPFMWAAVTELGLIRPSEMLDTEGGRWKTPYGRPIVDVTPKDKQTWTDVLVNSSNVGMVKGTALMNAEQMHDAVRRFGFGTPTRIGLAGESPGLVTPLKAWTKYTQTSVAFGYEVAVTPLQMIRAFSSLARTGNEAGTLPELSLIARQIDEPADPTSVIKRATSPQIAELTRRTIAGVNANLERRVLRSEAGEFRYDAFGKSGTAKIPLGKAPEGKKLPRGHQGYFPGQYISSFVCGAPLEQPRVVVLAIIDDPGTQAVRENRYYGAMVAGPVARRFLERGLTYLGVPPERDANDTIASGDPSGPARAN